MVEAVYLPQVSSAWFLLTSCEWSNAEHTSGCTPEWYQQLPPAPRVCVWVCVCVFTVPESPSAVLALVPDPAGEAHTVASGRVALAVHARFVAFLRLGRTGQPGEQPDDREQERGRQHQQAPAPARARAGPPCRPVHSRTKDGCFEAGAPPLSEDSDSTGWPLVAVPFVWTWGFGLPAGWRFSVFVLGWVFSWLMVYIFPVVPFPSRRTEPHIDIQKWRDGDRKCATGGGEEQGFKLLFWNQSGSPAPWQTACYLHHGIFYHIFYFDNIYCHESGGFF